MFKELKQKGFASLRSYDSGFYETLFFCITEVSNKVYEIRLLAKFLDIIAEIDLQGNEKSESSMH